MRRFRFVLSFMIMSFIIFTGSNCKNSDGTGSGSSSTATPVGAVKILLADIVAPVTNDPDNHQEEYQRTIKAIIVSLSKVKIYSTTRGWVEAVNLVSDVHPDGAFFELIGVKKGATPELGIFQLDKDDYSAVRFYFGSRNYVIATNRSGVLRDYSLKIETSSDSTTQANNEKLKIHSKGYRNDHSHTSSKTSTSLKSQNSSENQNSNNNDNGDNSDGDSDDERYIELQVSGGFYIDPATVTQITIGVDPLASVRSHDENYSLNPVMSVTNVATTAGASTLISAAAGGTISIPNDVTINIPAGALAQDTYVAIVPKQAVTPGNYRPEFIDMKNYVFLPHGLTMNSNATLRVQYDPAFINDINRVSNNSMLSEDFIDIQYFDETQQRYRSVGRNVDKTNHTLVAQINHFSDWTAALAISQSMLAAIMIDTTNPPPAEGFTNSTYQSRVNAKLNTSADWNTTSVNTTTQTPDPLTILSFDSLIRKMPTGASNTPTRMYIRQILDPTIYPPDATTDGDTTDGFQYTTVIAKAVRPLFLEHIEVKWKANATDYTPGYPMDPELFIISLNTMVPGLPTPNSMFDVPGFASTWISGYLSPNVILGAYLFYHAAQRHDLCDGYGGGLYKKTYTECNLDFIGNIDNNDPDIFHAIKSAEPMPTDPALLYPAKNPSFYNMATICNTLPEGLIKYQCGIALQDFRSAVMAKNGSDMNVKKCDDYDLMFVIGSLHTPPTDQRKTFCNGDTVDVGGIIDALAPIYPQFNDMKNNLSNGALRPLSNPSVVKTCPRAFTQDLPVHLDVRWTPTWTVPDDYDHKLNTRIEIFLNRHTLAGDTVPGIVDILIHLFYGQFIPIAPDPNGAADRIMPYYFSNYKYPDEYVIHQFLDPYIPNALHGVVDPMLQTYQDSLLPVRDRLLPLIVEPYGKYTYEIQPSVVAYPLKADGTQDYTLPIILKLKADPVTVTYCNPELLNLCWDTSNACP